MTSTDYPPRKLNDPMRRRLACADVMNAPDDYIAFVKPPSRSLDQNALLWPLLHELSKQIVWYGQKLTPDEWKDVMTAGLKKSKVVPGIDGGFVVIGASTSKMDKQTFSDLIELIYSFGAEMNVRFDPVKESKCKKCGADMKQGQAIAQTFTGMADFIGGEQCTLSPGGSGKLIECNKCPECGWSVTR